MTRTPADNFNLWKSASSCLVRSHTQIMHYNLCLISTIISKELILKISVDDH